MSILYMIDLESILSLTVLTACHWRLIPRGQGGFFPFNCHAVYFIWETFRSSEAELEEAPGWGAPCSVQRTRPTADSNCCFHLGSVGRGPEFGDHSAFSGHKNGGAHPTQPRDPSPPTGHSCPTQSPQISYCLWAVGTHDDMGRGDRAGDSEHRLPASTLLPALLYAFLRQLSP